MSNSNGDVAKLSPVSPGSDSAAPPPPKSLDSLTGMRFIAALMTFLFHTTLLINPLNFSWPAITPFADLEVAAWAAQAFSFSGFVGLSFFFLLSGFVITWSTRPDSSMRTYLRRRLVKVFPNHLVMWALVMLIFAGGVVAWTTWLPNALLIHAWFPDFSISQSMNVPAWSLSAEMLFYLSFPLLIKPISKLGTRGLWIGAASMVVGLALYQLAINFLVAGPAAGDPSAMSPMQYWLAYLFPPARMFEFGLGMFLARLVLADKWRMGPGLATVIMVVAFAATYFVPIQAALNFTTLAPIGIVVASFARADIRGTRTFLRNRPMVFLGKISFGFYLVQVLTVFYFQKALGGMTFSTPVAILFLAGLLVTSAIGGWLLFRFVETPMMRRFGRKSRKPAAPAPVQSVETTSPAATQEREAA